MDKFEASKTTIEGLWEVQPFCVSDNRGLFIKDYSKELLEGNGINYELKEVFYTVSDKGVIRGLHFQREIPQPKLVRCIYGRVYDVVVDLRKKSQTFGTWIGFDLSGDNRREILVPAGCAHGYLVLEKSIVSYKCAEQFYGEYDDGIIWNDRDLAIEWPINLTDGIVVLSDKDKQLNTFKKFCDLYGSL